MKPGTLLFVILVVGYLALEGYVASRTKYRMEPEFIFDQFSAAAVAVASCGTVEPEIQVKFQSNLRHTRRQAVAALTEENPAASPTDIEAMVIAREQTVREETEALIQAKGCDDIEAKKLIKRFKNRARLKLPTGD